MNILGSQFLSEWQSIFLAFVAYICTFLTQRSSNDAYWTLNKIDGAWIILSNIGMLLFAL